MTSLLVPKLQLGNALSRSSASSDAKQSFAEAGSQAGAWEPVKTEIPWKRISNRVSGCLREAACVLMHTVSVIPKRGVFFVTDALPVI